MKRYNNNYIEVLFFGAFGDLVTCLSRQNRKSTRCTIQTLENTKGQYKINNPEKLKGIIKNGQIRETVIIGHIRHRT